jgi:hypothetical protein
MPSICSVCRSMRANSRLRNKLHAAAGGANPLYPAPPAFFQRFGDGNLMAGMGLD